MTWSTSASIASQRGLWSADPWLGSLVVGRLGLGLPLGFLGSDNAIDAFAAGFLGFKCEAEPLAHDPGKEPADGMLLPAGHLHDAGDCHTLGSPQQVEYLLLFGIRPWLGLAGFLGRETFAALLAPDAGANF